MRPPPLALRGPIAGQAPSPAQHRAADSRPLQSRRRRASILTIPTRSSNPAKIENRTYSRAPRIPGSVIPRFPGPASCRHSPPHPPSIAPSAPPVVGPPLISFAATATNGRHSIFAARLPSSHTTHSRLQVRRLHASVATAVPVGQLRGSSNAHVPFLTLPKRKIPCLRSFRARDLSILDGRLRRREVRATFFFLDETAFYSIFVSFFTFGFFGRRLTDCLPASRSWNASSLPPLF